MINFIFGTPFVFFGPIIGELALVIAITAAILFGFMSVIGWVTKEDLTR